MDNLKLNFLPQMQFMLLFSRQGKLRLQKWYVPLSDKERKKISRDLVQTILARKPKMCSFLEWRDLKIVYKRYVNKRILNTGCVTLTHLQYVFHGWHLQYTLHINAGCICMYIHIINTRTNMQQRCLLLFQTLSDLFHDIWTRLSTQAWISGNF